MLPVVHPARAAGRAAADLAARPGSAAPIAGSDFFTFITPPPAPHVRCVRGAAATPAAISPTADGLSRGDPASYTWGRGVPLLPGGIDLAAGRACRRCSESDGNACLQIHRRARVTLRATCYA